MNLNYVKFLGISVDRKLTWSHHIDFISKKLSSVIFLLRRLAKHVTINCLKMVYYSYFQSIIHYGLVLWGNCVRKSEVLVLQKRALRSMKQCSNRAHCKPIFIEFKILTFVNLYIFELVKYILNHFSELTIRSNVHGYNTRNNSAVDYEYTRLSKSLNSHVAVGLRVYNKVRHGFVNLPNKTSLAKFYDWLLVNPFYSLEEFLTLKTCDISFN